MKMQNPLPRSTYDNWKAVREQADKLESEIIDRMDYVIKKCCDIFGHKLDTWWFDGAEEGEVGIPTIWNDKSFTCCLYFKDGSGKHDMFVVLNDDSEMNIGHDEFLIRWLFEDFEKELKDGIEKYHERVRVRVAELQKLSDKKRTEQEELITAATQKLSKKELAAIRKYYSSTAKK